ncbi:50S ribosomal protein L25 [bacterium]|nr:MAG: 50S ribosomal protein L25 [bacterium]
MKSIQLKAEIRKLRGSRESRRLRRTGFIPAVLYGSEGEHLLLKIFKKDFSKIIRSRSGEYSMVELLINDGNKETSHLSVIKNIQHDPVSDLVIHADFEYVQLGKPISFIVPIEFVGTPIGVKEGGIFTPHLHELKILCAPKDMPEVVEINVENIDLGESIHIKDISIPNAEIQHDPDETIASIVKPRGLEVSEVKEEEAEEAEEEKAEGEGEKKSETEEKEKKQG